MDGWALGIIAVGIIGYLALKRNSFFLFVTGVGVGLLAGALWAAAIILR
jgi:hypothetical protein